MHYSVIRSGWQNAFSRNKNAIARPKIAAISIISRHLIVLQASSEPDEWSNLGAQDGDDAFQWLQQQEVILGEEAEKETAEEQLAASVGIQFRTDTGLHTTIRNENDDQRFHWHRMLHTAAEEGDFTQAENVLKQMNENKQLPGPKAYHALVFSYVKGGYARGALSAIRTEVGKGIKPLPQTYACVLVAFLKESDLDTAIAIYASNRRSGLSAEASWRPLCTYLLNIGDFDQAMHFIEQGESDGWKPDPRMLYAIIRALCKTGDLKGSVERLKELCDSGHQPDKNILSTVVTAYAKSGKLKEAETLLLTLIEAPGATSASTIGSINAMLQMYMNAEFTKEELAKRISKLRQVMLRGGMTLDRKGYSLLLEASVQLEDPTVGWLAFQSLQTQPMGSLQYLTYQVLCDFLFDLSSFGEASKIDNVLAAMATERRKFNHSMMRTDAHGKTFVSRWLENAEQTRKKSNTYTIDGVALDSSNLCVLSENGEILAPTKMSVRELRAELAARQCPLRGNKKELIKQLQKARAEAEIEGAGPVSAQATKSKKVDIMIAEEAWIEGELEAQNTYEDEREEEQDDDDESQQVDEFGEDSEKLVKEEEEEDSFDYEDRIFAVMKAKVQKLDIHENLSFNHEEPGILEAIMILRRVITMGGIPTNQDILSLLSYLPQADDANLAEEILALVQGTSTLTEETIAKVNALISEKSVAQS